MIHPDIVQAMVNDHVELLRNEAKAGRLARNARKARRAGKHRAPRFAAAKRTFRLA